MSWAQCIFESSLPWRRTAIPCALAHCRFRTRASAEQAAPWIGSVSALFSDKLLRISSACLPLVRRHLPMSRRYKSPHYFYSSNYLFKHFISLKVVQEQEIIHLLVHSPDVCNSQGWTAQRTRAASPSEVSYMGGRDPGTCAITSMCLLGTHWQEARSEAKVGPSARHS